MGSSIERGSPILMKIGPGESIWRRSRFHDKLPSRAVGRPTVVRTGVRWFGGSRHGLVRAFGHTS